MAPRSRPFLILVSIIETRSARLEPLESTVRLEAVAGVTSVTGAVSEDMEIGGGWPEPEPPRRGKCAEMGAPSPPEGSERARLLTVVRGIERDSKEWFFRVALFSLN